MSGWWAPQLAGVQDGLGLCLGELLPLVLQCAGGKAQRKAVQAMGKRANELGLAQ